jgi:hypothetical protein
VSVLRNLFGDESNTLDVTEALSQTSCDAEPVIAQHKGGPQLTGKIKTSFLTRAAGLVSWHKKNQ